jgi:GNAT superfamily N-acetyltransferase
VSRVTLPIDGLDVRRAESQAEREAIFRFRGDDPLDREGCVIGAWVGPMLAGTVTLSFARDASTQRHLETRGIHTFRALDLSAVSVTTHLLVAPRFQSTGIGVALARYAYALARSEAMAVDLTECSLSLVAFFTRLGYRQYLENMPHPRFGAVSPMMLLLGDYEHLRAVRSPLADLCRAIRPYRMASAVM